MADTNSTTPAAAAQGAQDTPASTAANTTNTNTETAAQHPAAAAQGAQDNTALYNLLNKVLEQRSDGLARSALKSNGIEDDAEAKQIIADWKANRAQAAQAAQTATNSMQQENAALKQQMAELRMNTAAQQQAATLGIDTAKLPYVLKLADMSGCTDEKGEPVADKITEALNKVLTALPEFKKAAAGGAGFKVGGDGDTNAAGAAAAKSSNAVKTNRWNRWK